MAIFGLPQTISHVNDPVLSKHLSNATNGW